MTAAAIAIGTGGTGISPGAGSGISSVPARGVQPSGNSGGDGVGRWQQSLQQAGVGQQGSSQDSPISAAGDGPTSDPSGDRTAQFSLAHGHALAQRISALKPDAAISRAGVALASKNSQLNTDEAASWFGSGRTAPAKANGKADTHLKDASVATAQGLLASLAMPAAVTLPAPLANAKVSADSKTNLFMNADSSNTRSRGGANGDAFGTLSAKLVAAAQADAPAAEKGIAAQGSAGIQPANAGATLNKQAAQDALLSDSGLLDLGRNPSQAADASAQSRAPSSANAALAAGSQASVPSAAQSAAQTSSVNTNNLSHAENLSASVVASHAAAAASADSNWKIQNSSAESSSAGHEHAGSGRDQATNPAQGQGSSAAISLTAQASANGQAQTFAAPGHTALNGPALNEQAPRGTSGIAGSASHSSDPFSSIDSGALVDSRGDSTNGSATWIHAGTHAAEAGFQDPLLGWVGVRAQVAGGAIQASVVPSSSDAAQALGGHLAGLHAYLADHHALAGTVTMARPEASAGWSGAGHGAGQGQGSNQGGGAPMYGGSSGGHAGASQQQADNAALEGVRGVSSGAVAHAAAVPHTSPPIAFRGGGLISVVA